MSKGRSGGHEEIPLVQGQERRPRGATPRQGSGREEQPQVQRVVAVRAQEGLEELFHVQGQEGQQ